MSNSKAGRSHGRAFGLSFALALVAALALASIASAASDPVSSGSLTLKLKVKNGKVKPSAPKLSISSGGSIDPGNLSGSSAATGSFKATPKGGKAVKVSFTNLTLSGGGAGNIDAKVKSKTVKKCITFTGGTVGRSGFDSSLSGGKVKISSGCAKQINKLGKKKKPAKLKTATGKISAGSVVYSTLHVTGGNAVLKIDPASVTKYGTHGVPSASITAVTPATGTSTGTITLPADPTTSTASPDLTQGSETSLGGVLFKKTAVSQSSGALTCSATGNEVRFLNTIFNLSAKTVDAGPGSELFLPSSSTHTSVAGASALNVTLTSVTQDPATKTVTGTGSLFTASASAGIQNGLFGSSATAPADGGPCNTAPNDFAGGELFGVATLTLVLE